MVGGGVSLRLKALRSLRWNYTRKGVWFWLKGRQRCRICGGSGKVAPQPTDPLGVIVDYRCHRCHGRPQRGYQRVLAEPGRVLAEQTQLAEGVFV